MPEFWRLVREAYHAGEAVDAFDLRSEDATSVSTFGKLVYHQAIAVGALISYVRKGGFDVAPHQHQ